MAAAAAAAAAATMMAAAAVMAAAALTLGGGIRRWAEGQHLEVEHFLGGGVQQFADLAAAAAGQYKNKEQGEQLVRLPHCALPTKPSGPCGLLHSLQVPPLHTAACLAHLASGSHSGPPSIMTSSEAVGTWSVVEPCLWHGGSRTSGSPSEGHRGDTRRAPEHL